MVFSFNDKSGMVEGGDVAGGNDEPHVQLVDAHRVERLQRHHVENLVHRVVRPHHADVFHNATAREKNGTPTKRQVSKHQVSKCLVSKRPVSKRQVYKTSGLQNVRFQNVWFQNV